MIAATIFSTQIKLTEKIGVRPSGAIDLGPGFESQGNFDLLMKHILYRLQITLENAS